MMNPTIKVTSKDQIQRAANWLTGMLTKGLESGPVVVSLSREKRNNDQNSLLWALLTDIADHCTWPIQNGRVLAPEKWKLLLMSAYRQEVNSVVMGINGEPVNLSLSTSKLSKAEFSEFIELVYAIGSGYGVQWSDKATDAYQEATK